jgi:hypothetical protein
MATSKNKPAVEDIKEKANFVVKASILKKLKYIALVEDLYQADIVNEAFEDYIGKYEKKNGEIKLK